MASKRAGAMDCEKADINEDINNKRKEHFRKERMAKVLRS
jgi:hypothetical protein